MSCGVACVFIIFICQNGLLQVSNAEENATTSVPSTQESGVSHPPAQEPTTLELPAPQPLAQDLTAQNSSAPELQAKDTSKQDKIETDPFAPESNTREGNTTEKLNNTKEFVNSKEPLKFIEDELPTKRAIDDVTKEEVRKEVTSSAAPSSADPPTAAKLTKETTTLVNEPRKSNDDEQGTNKDGEKVTQEPKPNDKENKDEELSTIAPPKGILDLGILSSILQKEKPNRRTPVDFAEVRNDIESAVSRSVDSTKHFARNAYNVMKSAVSNVFNR